MGFAKLDAGIVKSSLWSEPLGTRVVFVTMLAMADSNGFVGASRSGLMRASNVPAEDFEKAIYCLESPDDDSRSENDDGRRIVKGNGGWQIINYKHYREFSYSSNSEAVRKRKYREREFEEKRDTVGHVPKMAGHSASASASASAEAAYYNKNNEESYGGEKLKTPQPINIDSFDEEHVKTAPQPINNNPAKVSFNINGYPITYSFYQKVLQVCQGDYEVCGRVFYRAQVKAHKNPIGWIQGGLLKGFDGKRYAFNSIREEDERPGEVRNFIDRVICKYNDAEKICA